MNRNHWKDEPKQLEGNHHVTTLNGRHKLVSIYTAISQTISLICLDRFVNVVYHHQY